ncbi:MAG TPA: hypothetical protein VKV32_15925 [Stellaceae bacterium]|nr:hypothetical protein [Stellaceae bacterium]
MAEPRPLNFLWRRTTLDNILEGYFIANILLGAIGRPVRVIPFEDGQPVPLGPDTLIGSLALETVPLLKEARQRGIRNIGFFHMDDEEGKHDLSFYADADYVIRNYWHRHAFARHGNSLGVTWVPNGYRTGLGPIDPARHLGIAQRSVMGFFSGAMSGRLMAGQRAAMLQAVRQAALPFTIITTGGFGQGLGPTAYAAWLSNTRFALVPAGNSHETIRLYDALEAGAIPIMVRSAFIEEPQALGALGKPPFILLDSWDGLAAAYAPYADANAPATIAKLEQQRQAVVTWWAAFKRHVQQAVKDVIDRSFARSE